MTPRVGVPLLGRVHISYIVKFIIPLKVFFSSPRHRTDKVSIQVWYPRKGLPTLWISRPLGQGFFARPIRVFPCKSYSEIALFLLKFLKKWICIIFYINIHHIDCYCIKGMLHSFASVDFHLFPDGATDIQIWALQTRSQCRVFDSQLTVNALWPLIT